MEKRALVTDLQDKIIALLVEKQEAWAKGNATLVERLQHNIERLRAEYVDIRQDHADC